jgi:hypothetical protein
MAEKSNCLLGREARCDSSRTCYRCGWNPEVAEARNRMIKENGLTQGPDGVRRLIIRKGGTANGNT